MRITSRKNSHLLHLRKLLRDSAYGRDCGEFVLEGRKLLSSALEAKFPVKQYVVIDKAEPPQGAESVLTVPKDIMAWLSPQKSPSDILFVADIPQQPFTKPQGSYLILDRVQDTGNVGTLWRTAQGLGATALILLEDCVNPWGSKCLRSAMGACFHIPIYEMTTEEMLQQFSDYPLYGTDLQEDSLSLKEVSLKDCAVILGNEGQGVRKELLASCHKTLYLPMSQGCQSLNVAVTGSILLWEMFQQSESELP